MSMGPLGMIGSAAGSPMAQRTGTDVEKADQETANQSRQAKAEQNAENAAGIGHTEEDSGAQDRDADGRRIWELPEEKQEEATGDEQQSPPQADTPLSRDATGERGNHLDLSG